MDLSKVKEADLKQEIKRRDELRRIPPEMKKEIDIEPLKKVVMSYIKNIKESYVEDAYVEDWDNIIYEEAVTMFYGHEFWEWLNNL